MFEQIVRFIQDGGNSMYPIMAVMGIGIAITLERYIYLTMARSRNRREWNALMPVLNGGDYQRAYTMTTQSDAAVAKVINYGLSRLSSTNRLEDVEAAMEEGLMEVTPRYEKRTHYLATLANVATLLGLLGTVIGLIRAFASVAAADPAEKAAMLASSISIAMNATAFGLMVAIPLLLMYSVLQTKTTELVDTMEMAAVKFNNMVRRHNAKKV